MKNEINDIDIDELMRLMEIGVPLIDIRAESEWKQGGVIAGSRLLPLCDARGQADPARWLERVRAVAGPEEALALICVRGVRSRAAAHFLIAQAGYRKVYDAAFGIAGWVEAGRPLTPYVAS